MISVLILTYNEESNIRRCLDSVSWSDDVVVIDSFSTDRTVEVARASGARVLQHSFTNFADQRNFGIEQGDLKNDWVLHLDADEVVTPEFYKELVSMASQNSFLAYRVSLKLFFHGRWVRHSSMYPCYQVRFGRRDALGFVQIGHGQRESLPATSIGTMKRSLLHYPFSKGMEEWFAKHNRYSSAEAAENVRSLTVGRMPWAQLVSSNKTSRWRALKELSIRLPFRPAIRFFYLYFFRMGFLDGAAGWCYCQMLSIYEGMIALKVKELELAALEDSARGAKSVAAD
jgi:glycosyltransferase involved in cell wall biosynthesis